MNTTPTPSTCPAVGNTVAYSFTGDCFYGSFLASADGSGFGDSIASGSGPVDGNTNVYGVEAGTYYVKMITGPSPGCPWRIVLVRQ